MSARQTWVAVGWVGPTLLTFYGLILATYALGLAPGSAVASRAQAQSESPAVAVDRLTVEVRGLLSEVRSLRIEAGELRRSVDRAGQACRSTAR
jgi:hypothetical protein